MKSIIFSILALIGSIGVFAQNLKLEYRERNNPSIKKDNIQHAISVVDLAEGFWQRMELPFIQKGEFDKLMETDLAKGNYIFPLAETEYARVNHNNIIDILSVNISTTSYGLAWSVTGKDEFLSSDQKNMLASSDLGSNIEVKVKFVYKDQTKRTKDIIEGKLVITIIPEVEAEFPGGNNNISGYFTNSFEGRLADADKIFRVQNAIIRFVVDEEGQIKNARIFRSTNDEVLDNMLLDVTNKMQRWQAAKDALGRKVKQEFAIQFVNEGC